MIICVQLFKCQNLIIDVLFINFIVIVLNFVFFFRWQSMCLLRQFKDKKMFIEVIKKIEKKNFFFERFYDFDFLEIGEFIRVLKSGKIIYKYVYFFFKLELFVYVQLIIRVILRVELIIIFDFQWSEEVYGIFEVRDLILVISFNKQIIVIFRYFI